MITVIVVDDHPVVRAGLLTVLAAAPDIEVLGEATTGAEALRIVAQERPDVVVLDVHLPDVSGLTVARELRQRESPTKVLVLSAHDDPETVWGLLRGGATGYVLKDEALETLAQAVRAAARGESWLSPTVARHVVDRAAGRPAPAPPPALDDLTPREREVLQLLAGGLDNAAIAEALVITQRTVQNYVSTIYGKLGVDSRTQAALYAIRHGLADVSPPEPSDVR
jgi:DNA-binding NarL/FixJ family response regulator